MNCTVHFKAEVEGKKIRFVRLIEKEWTLTQLAEASGVTRKTITEIEKGLKENVKFSTLKKIADALEKDVFYFLSYKY